MLQKLSRLLHTMRVTLFFTLVFYPQISSGLNLDGEGHYSLRGETRTKPGMARDRGIHQAIDQSFRLLGEARVNDRSSFFLEFRLFDDPRNAYLGDKSKAQCDKNGENCVYPHQNVKEPQYQEYIPRVTQAYTRYAFDFFIVEAGRKKRDWGLGLFLDGGANPFAQDASIYDGISFDINIQKTQSLGVSFGFDKISETGSYIREPLQIDKEIKFGPGNSSDDANQIFVALVFDDRKSNAGAALTKHIGIYGAKVSSADITKGGSNTDITFVDLYTGFFYKNLQLKNEILFTLGKTADPNMTYLGGAYEDNADIVTNKVSSLAFAGELLWTLASSGSYIGPEVYRKGDATRHLLLLDYAFAPGDPEGYYNYDYLSGSSGSENSALSVKNRSKEAKAVAFHRNFKPALIMFNGRSQIDDLIVEGVFDPGRVMNAQVYSLGYRYEDLSIGNFEVKGIYGTLNTSIPESVKDHYANASGDKPIGYYGTDLGFELDFKYWTNFGKDIDVGLAAGALMPGQAWKISESLDPDPNYLVQSYISFNF